MRYKDYDKDRILFQFHKGAIKTGTMYKAFKSRPCFNSIKVRLKLFSYEELNLFFLVSIP